MSGSAKDAHQVDRVQELLNAASILALTTDRSEEGTTSPLEATLRDLADALSGTAEHALAERALAALLRTEGSADPEPAFAEIATLLDELEAARAAGSTATPSARLTKETTALRDAETVELFCDFLSESGDGLDTADEILLNAEQCGAQVEQINALFRVFHSIKGVSACLDATEVTRLAHVTETLLGKVRSGEVSLSGATVDAVLEASAGMRRLLGLVRRAVDADAPIASDPATPALIDRIEAAGAATARGTASTAEPRAPEHAPQNADASDAQDAALEAPHAAEASTGARLRETVKVDLERIDSVVEMIGELIIVESMVVNAPEIAGLSSLRVRNYLGQLTKISRDLQNIAMRMRMVPLRGVFQKMARVARDTARKMGKDAQFVQSGETTEMDRSMVERIEDPLLHMIRNALDHAIEAPEERRAAGKPATGVLKLSARHEGGSIAIELSDDGRGLDRGAILAKARQQGLVTERDEELSDSDVFALIFRPGFSTAARVTEVSGRGVGMDVVKRNVEDMRGRVEVQSKRGQGTTFKLVLPLTLAIIDGMLLACGGERYIVPSLSIVQSLQPEPGMVRTPCERGEILVARGEVLPLLRLRQLFQIPGEDPPVERAHVVVLESAGRKVGLLVDDVVTQQQVVIKPLGEALSGSEFFAGGAILSDGLVGLILNVDRLVSLFGASRRGAEKARERAA